MYNLTPLLNRLLGQYAFEMRIQASQILAWSVVHRIRDIVRWSDSQAEAAEKVGQYLNGGCPEYPYNLDSLRKFLAS